MTNGSLVKLTLLNNIYNYLDNVRFTPLHYFYTEQNAHVACHQETYKHHPVSRFLFMGLNMQQT